MRELRTLFPIITSSVQASVLYKGAIFLVKLRTNNTQDWQIMAGGSTDTGGQVKVSIFFSGWGPGTQNQGRP